ncbi:MAG: sulfurtransferase-like selenium metabolism protein YedF [Deltaproteobacteria bacterium HGW-Deltaproteobacteria-7]|jgi:selenium metabolism protein YedF|nr:MAG: sulfurtransferase-like selenium metabolism protein YedF [Deltaproteobacteria bacterium HGW-Deltaproteobacteria-7]PKN53640.1 MAG: sulfurtransferase-like selenium metabolism protein YedF [Deltaproteobacteria bacterium HGW-Deltaproteobacteria-13]
MSKTKIVNARGLSCPQPVILAKQAIETNEQVKVIVDNETALENVKRLGTKQGCDVQVEKKNDGTYEINLTRKAGAIVTKEEFVPSCDATPAASGPFVIVISADTMGRGNDELGNVLIRAFLHTVCQQKEKPAVMIFYNTGVKLTVQGSEVLEDLKQLESEGVQLLVCGTCLNYFEIKDKIAAGTVSNMYDIVETMSRAGRLLVP